MHFSVKEDIIQLTEKWDGERFPDGRPRVSDEDLEEIRHLTLEEVWQPMFMKGYLNQFEEKLKRLHISYDYISFYQSINHPLVAGSFSSLRSTDLLYSLLRSGLAGMKEQVTALPTSFVLSS